jgi:hypothetical protein
VNPRVLGGEGFEGDAVAEGLELGDSPLTLAIGVASGEVVATKVGVGAVAGQQVPGDDQDKTYREGQRFATRGGRFLPFHAGEAHVGIARVLYARAQLDDALQHVTEGIELTRRWSSFGCQPLDW